MADFLVKSMEELYDRLEQLEDDKTQRNLKMANEFLSPSKNIKNLTTTLSEIKVDISRAAKPPKGAAAYGKTPDTNHSEYDFLTPLDELKFSNNKLKH